MVFVFCVFNPLHHVYTFLVITCDLSEFEYHDELVCHLKYKSTTGEQRSLSMSSQLTFTDKF